MYTVLALVMLSSAPAHIRWQNSHKAPAQVYVLAGNVALGCLKAGIGAAYHGNNFFEGCLKGSVSGAITFAGKWLATYQEYPGMGAVGRMVGSLGISMTDNVMLGQDWFANYWLDLGPLNLQFSRGSWAPRASYNLTSLVGISVAVAKGYRFEGAQSFSNLVPIFSMPEDLNTQWDGYVLGQSIVYQRDYRPAQDVLSHEMVHTVQWSEFRVCGELGSWGGWNVGHDICGLASYAPALSETTYFYSPFEIEAYSLEKSR